MAQAVNHVLPGLLTALGHEKNWNIYNLRTDSERIADGARHDLNSVTAESQLREVPLDEVMAEPVVRPLNGWDILLDYSTVNRPC
jgi:hypothetical protein